MTGTDGSLPTVVFDTQSLSSVQSGSGNGTYIRNIVAALARRLDIDLLALGQADVTLPDSVRTVPLHRRARRPRAQLIEHSVRLPADLWRWRPAGSVVHIPTFHAPPAVRPPRVQTLHDVIPLVFDAPDLAALRARWKRFAPRYRAASAVIAISQHAATEGIRILGLDPDRVHVARHGVDPRFRPGSGGPADPPYLLVVGEFSRRKGFAEAFGVMDALADRGYPHRLLVAGRVHPGAEREVAALRGGARHPERIELLDFVPDLVSLYQGATGFLMTSRYEGFGLPVLEAMASGTPVVAFANSAVIEVVGDGGQLVPDGDVEAMTSAIRRLLDNPNLASEWQERGLDHVAPFTWDRSAGIHAEVYRMVAKADAA